MKQNLSIDKARTFKGLSGVYKITNLNTGEFYIGSSKNLQKRYREWRADFNSKRHFNWFYTNKIENFEFEVIELVESTKDKLLEREQHWVDKLKPILNKQIENVKGGNNFRGNFNKLKRKPILQLDLEGNLIKEWPFLNKIKEDGYNPGYVGCICQNKTRYKTHKGYKWKYKD